MVQIETRACVPGAHAVHVDEPVAEIEPFAQSEHLDAPVAPEKLPGSHCWHTLEPDPPAYDPSLHGSQNTLPRMSVAMPLLHSSHLVAPSCPPNLPEEQRTQLLEPSLGAKLPRAHGAHEVRPVAPPYEPAGHGVHMEARGKSEYLPTSHFAHDPDSAPPDLEPAAHGVQELAPTAETVPAGQESQRPSPATSAYSPATQGVHCDDPRADVAVPTGHGRHGPPFLLNLPTGHWMQTAFALLLNGLTVCPGGHGPGAEGGDTVLDNMENGSS